MICSALLKQLCMGMLMQTFGMRSEAQLLTYAGIVNTLSEEAIATMAMASAVQPSGTADSRTLPYRGSTGSFAS